MLSSNDLMLKIAEGISRRKELTGASVLAASRPRRPLAFGPLIMLAKPRTNHIERKKV